MVGSKTSVAAAEDEPVGRLRRRAAAATPSSSCSSTSAWRIRISLPAGPCTVNRSQPTRFWPKSTSVRPDGEVRIATGRSRPVGVPPDRCTARAGSCRSRRSATGYSGTTWNMSSVGRTARTTLRAAPRRRWSGRRTDRRRGRPSPSTFHDSSVADALNVAVGERDLELGDDAELGRRRGRARP